MATANKKSITLRGSSTVVTEFFEYAISNILYQRGVFPPEDFCIVKKYGVSIMRASNDAVYKYLHTIMTQVHAWITEGKVKKVVLAIKDKDTNQILESASGELKTAPRDEKVIQGEIQSIIRQITASVTFLPELVSRATFNVLVFTSWDLEVSQDWVDTDAHNFDCASEQVRLRSFSTNFHKIDSMVEYKIMED